ncbi:hypothetical protein ACGIF2_07870 [Cellulomonas sp. P22]|uniref:hypothetical protein n=1 Tax=Cellulomonas sp. P22 TaxID=3373189 RepID=UPI00378F79CC
MADRGGDGRVAPTRLRAQNRRFVALAVSLALLAVVVRLGPVLYRRSLRGVIGYDDGVHLAAAQHLLAGDLPYTDFTFLQPGGVVVALTPFAAVAGLVGDSWALAAARVAVVLVAAVNAVLVAAILRPRGLVAAAVGGVLYAGWATIVIAERTVYLEPLLNVCLLVALLALRRRPDPASAGPPGSPGPPGPSASSARAVAVAGVALGLGVGFKLWGVAAVVVLGALVLARGGVRSAVRGAAWCVVGLLPALVLAAADPAAAWRDVVVVQRERAPSEIGALDRIGTLVGPALFTGPTIGRGLAVAGGALLVAMCLVPVGRALVRRVPPRAWSDPVWWGLLALVQLALLLVAPSWGTHYPAYLGPALCLLLGAGAGRLAARAAPRVGRVGRPVAGVVAGVVAVPLVLAGVAAPGWGRPVDNAPLAAFAGEQPCTWSATPSLLAAADASRRQIRAGCPDVVDIFGIRLALAAGYPVPEVEALDLGTSPGRGLEPDEELLQAQMAASQAALLTNVFTANDMSEQLAGWVRAEFTQVGTNHYVGLWVRRP